MTESDWLSYMDPLQMLKQLEGRLSERKRRLFACACARRFWGVVGDERYRGAVETAERFADGGATSEELLSAELNADAGPEFASQFYSVLLAASKAASPPPCNCEAVVRFACRGAAYRAFCEAVMAGRRRIQGDPKDAERAAQAAILRDIVGNPFRAFLADSFWLAWGDGTVAKLAQAIYEQRRFADMPILADALEDAGCADDTILAHCRQSGEHVRGCWVVDLLTGKDKW